MALTWAIVFTCLALAFIGNYAVLPHYDHRYRAVFFPGGELGGECRLGDPAAAAVLCSQELVRGPANE